MSYRLQLGEASTTVKGGITNLRNPTIGVLTIASGSRVKSALSSSAVNIIVFGIASTYVLKPGIISLYIGKAESFDFA
jgi:hypothetical protein